MYAIWISSVRAVRDARHFGVGDGGDSRPDFYLLVALDGGLRGTAAFLAPYDRDRRTGLAVRHVDYAERNHHALVVGVPGVGGHADGLAVFDDFIERQGRVVG